MEKGIALLSGGIDSPVAIHLMKNRLDVIAVHFHQMPLTDEKEVDKVKELVRLLGVKKVYLIPFVDVLKALVEKCNHANYFILGKIVMMKCSEIIANREGAKFLITGENLAQVSSQTLSNLKTITSFLDLEIFRPVLTYDKQEIIKVANDINTYDISKGPEICNLLGPKSPKTKSKKEDIAKELEKLDLAVLFNDAIDRAEIIEG
jgi:thiamine biosynthesis protein ThiI